MGHEIARDYWSTWRLVDRQESERSVNQALLLILVAAFGGGMLNAFMGFLDAKEPFDSRKFGKSVITCIIGALVISVGFAFSNGITTRDIFMAILAGAGVEAGTNRALGAIRK